MAELIYVTKENIQQEHICCCMSGKKESEGEKAKKEWLSEQFEHGLSFVKLNVRGKVFIEYIPAEYAWVPIEAKGYMHINCLWVSGQYKGQGYSNQLLDVCIQDAKQRGMRGLTIVSSEKKKPFLCDSKFLRYKGFQLCDSASPFFQLYYLPFEETAKPPVIRPCAKEGVIHEDGIVLYYTDQCPYTFHYVSLCEAIAEKHAVRFQKRKIVSMAQAQAAPSLVTTYALFQNGILLTNEILSEKKFELLLGKQ